MTVVNLQMMPTNAPINFLPLHSRSNSVSSNSTHGSHSRPHSSQGFAFNRLPPAAGPSPEDLYRASYHPAGQSLIHGDSLQNHIMSNPALKGPLRPTHLRARVAASPYPRDTDSLSSSSETEDISMYLSAQTPSDYPSQMYATGPSMVPQSQEAIGAFGRMSLSPDHGLEKLAANVRAATTTSASDRAKQIFVQAWLTANYAPYPDGNVPRQGLYFSYRRVCDQYGIPHINTATLGKAIRLCFPSIKTRRLGVRGNSKYHYCGIRPATAAEAEWLQDYIQKSNNRGHMEEVLKADLALREPGLGFHALQTLEWMLRQELMGPNGPKIRPALSTYNLVIQACMYSGDWNGAKRTFDLMTGYQAHDFMDGSVVPTPRLDKRGSSRNFSPNAEFMSFMLRTAIATRNKADLRQALRIVDHIGYDTIMTVRGEVVQETMKLAKRRGFINEKFNSALAEAVDLVLEGSGRHTRPGEMAKFRLLRQRTEGQD